MQHFILRCKHCQKEYTYCTYGNGPEYGTDEGCSMEYCAECQKAIDKALGEIPVKFKRVFQEIEVPTLLDALKNVKIKYEEEREKSLLGGFPQIVPCTYGKYDNVEKYVHNGKTFKVEWNDETPDEKHVSIEVEYDILKKKSTGRPWKTNKKDSYLYYHTMNKRWEELGKSIAEIDPMPLTEPCGQLFFMDLNPDEYQWDVVSPPSPAPKPKKHVLHINTYTDPGVTLNMHIKYGWGDKKVVILAEVVAKEPVDYLEYSYTIHEYEDEDTVYITDIHVA